MRGSFRSEVSGWRLIAGYLGVVLMLIGGIIPVSYTHLDLR